MREIAEETYSDINNNNTVDKEDNIGYCTNMHNGLDAIFYSCNAKVTRRDKDDIPYFTIMEEHTADVCAKLYKLIWNTKGVRFDNNLADNLAQFNKGQCTFIAGFFYDAESFRDMKDDYGILPVPKYDELQTDYVTGLHNVMRDMVIPINCQKLEAVCAVLEEMAFQGYSSVLPIYYDSILKFKYARDEASGQMIDIIRNNCTTDFAYIYGDYCSQMGLLFRTMIGNKQDSITSLYESRNLQLRN
jgi:hypothetical protein